MALSLAESQVINEMAALLYSFLPGTPHPYANAAISFAGVAHELGISKLWTGGSKLPAITTLLGSTLETQRGLFCRLVLEIVRRGLTYRNSKASPVTVEEIRALNDLLVRVEFKIPELWDPAFLDSLPKKQPEGMDTEQAGVAPAELAKLKDQLIGLEKLRAQEQGYAFERFLQEMFSIHNLAPRSAFKLVGEQIDGSLQFEAHTYLVEAKWQGEQTPQADLLVFREKVESKSTWSRGLFISRSGFTEEGLQAFSTGRSTNIISMTGQDLFFILDGEIPLPDAIECKARWAAETGQFHISVYDLVRGGMRRRT